MHAYIRAQTHLYTYVDVCTYAHTHVTDTHTHRRAPGTAKHRSDTSTAGFAVGQRVAQRTRSPFTAALEIQVLRTDTASFLTDGTRHGKCPPPPAPAARPQSAPALNSGSPAPRPLPARDSRSAAQRPLRHRDRSTTDSAEKTPRTRQNASHLVAIVGVQAGGRSQTRRIRSGRRLRRW